MEINGRLENVLKMSLCYYVWQRGSLGSMRHWTGILMPAAQVSLLYIFCDRRGRRCRRLRWRPSSPCAVIRTRRVARWYDSFDP